MKEKEDNRETISKDAFIDYLKEQLKIDERGILKKIMDLNTLDRQIEDQLLEGGDDAIIKVPKPLNMIVYCANLLGWGFIIMKNNQELNGFILGNNDFLTKYGNKLEE